jgi:hypothetical protein
MDESVAAFLPCIPRGVQTIPEVAGCYYEDVDQAYTGEFGEDRIFLRAI